MVTVAPARLITADELLELDAQGVRGELIRGVLCEFMPAGFEHGEIAMLLGSQLISYVRPRRLGRVIGFDSGVRLERDPDTVREPDLAFFAAERVPLDSVIRGYVDVIPDLVVEVKSPNDQRADVHDKALMWLSYGVQLVWVVLPETRSVDVYRSARDVSTVTDGGELGGGEALPGFRCALVDIFGPRPEPGGRAGGDQSADGA